MGLLASVLTVLITLLAIVFGTVAFMWLERYFRRRAAPKVVPFWQHWLAYFALLLPVLLMGGYVAFDAQSQGIWYGFGASALIAIVGAARLTARQRSAAQHVQRDAVRRR